MEIDISELEKVLADMHTQVEKENNTLAEYESRLVGLREEHRETVSTLELYITNLSMAIEKLKREQA